MRELKIKKMTSPAMAVKGIVNEPRELMMIPVVRFWMVQPCFWKVVFELG